MQHDRQFYKTLMFAIEQWFALLIGIACLAAFVWAAFKGHKAFSQWHFSYLGSNALVAIGWFVTITVGFLGITLIRFAFYESRGLDAPARSTYRKAKTTDGNPA